MHRMAIAILAICLVWSTPAVSSTFRIEERNIALFGSWFSEVNPEYSGGTAVFANFHVFDPDAYAYFEFAGTGITWIGARTFNAGLFEWVIDEGTADEIGGTVNTYIDGTERFTTEVLATDLSPGMHTFTFRSLGIFGRTMTSGIPSETYIDAFEVTPVPIPSTLALFSLGLAGLGVMRRKKSLIHT